MLFPYVYVPHKMDKMQEFIDFIFHEVWCKAPMSDKYELCLFDANSELKEVMEKFHFSDANGAYFFNSHVERIYGIFADLAPAQIEQLILWYNGNNDLESVCANNPSVQTASHVDVAKIDGYLAAQLKSFFMGLYSKSLLDLVALRAKIGDIDDHYQCFVEKNNFGKCPFCGITDLLGEYHSKREAYDHYLPKSIYPFNSINFKNLVPACHVCNSSYKTNKDPAYTPKDPIQPAARCAFFYPYEKTTYAIELQIELQCSDVEGMTPSDIELEFGPARLKDKIDTWSYVYGIDERYKAKLCSESDGRYWLMQVLDEWKEDERLPDDYLRALQRQADKNPHAECNFLKKPFLDACKKIGIFSSI